MFSPGSQETKSDRERIQELREERNATRAKINALQTKIDQLTTQSYLSILASSITSIFSKPKIDPQLESLLEEQVILTEQLQRQQAMLKTLRNKHYDNYIVDTKADLESYPPQHPSERILPGTYIPVGDLHGCALKLIYILLRHQLIHMSREDYDKIVAIYKAPIPNPDSPDFDSEKIAYKNNLNEYNKIMSECILSADPNLVGKIYLLGDLVGDRGMNDYFTFKLFSLLMSNKDDNGVSIATNTVGSNHDNVALLKLFNNVDCYPSPQHAKYKNSLVNLEKCIAMGLVDKNKIITMITKDYLPNLKIIAYTEHWDENNQHHITLIHHAPCYVYDILQNAAQHYYIDMRLDGSKHNLLTMIDKVNDKFISESKGIIEENNPLYHLIWDRGLSGQPDEDISPTVERLPAIYDDASMHYIHGHDLHKNATAMYTSKDQSCLVGMNKKQLFERFFGKSILPQMNGYDNNFGREPNEPVGIYFTKILPERKYDYVLVSQAIPRTAKLKHNTAVVVKKANNLTAYWIEKGIKQSRTIPNNLVEDILAKLPAPDSAAIKDSALLKLIIPRFVYNQEPKEKPMLTKKHS